MKRVMLVLAVLPMMVFAAFLYFSSASGAQTGCETTDQACFHITDERGTDPNDSQNMNKGRLNAENQYMKIVWHYDPLNGDLHDGVADQYETYDEYGNRGGGNIYELYDKRTDPGMDRNLISEIDACDVNDCTTCSPGESCWKSFGPGSGLQMAGIGGLGVTSVYDNLKIVDGVLKAAPSASDNTVRGKVQYIEHHPEGNEYVLTIRVSVFSTYDSGSLPVYTVEKIWRVHPDGRLDANIKITFDRDFHGGPDGMCEAGESSCISEPTMNFAFNPEYGWTKVSSVRHQGAEGICTDANGNDLAGVSNFNNRKTIIENIDEVSDYDRQNMHTQTFMLYGQESGSAMRLSINKDDGGFEKAGAPSPGLFAYGANTILGGNEPYEPMKRIGEPTSEFSKFVVNAYGYAFRFYSWWGGAPPPLARFSKSVDIGDSYSDSFSIELIPYNPDYIWRVSTGIDDLEGNGDSAIESPDVSSDGRFVTFVSTSTNISAGSRNALPGIFLKDTQVGVTTLLSKKGANGPSSNPAISADGRYVAFVSDATNLVTQDRNDVADVFLLDRDSGVVVRVSEGAAGEANGASDLPDIALHTENGASQVLVVFQSDATNLTPTDGNSQRDIFVKNISTGQIERVSTTSSGDESLGGPSENPSISDDGTRIAFASDADNFYGDSGWQIYVKDRINNGNLSLISSTATGAPGNGASLDPAISGSGEKVAFHSSADDLDISDNNQAGDVFVANADGSDVRLVSSSWAGNCGNGFSQNAAITNDGRYVAFRSDSTDFDTNDANGMTDIFVKDTYNGHIELLSIGTLGQQTSAENYKPAISGDGKYALFASADATIVPRDNNGKVDVFMREVLPDVPHSTPVEPGLVSNGSASSYANGDSDKSSVTAEGQYVAFRSSATDLIPGGTTGTQVFVKDTASGSGGVSLVSANTSGSSGNGTSNDPSIASANACLVAFSSTSTNLIPGGSSGQQIFVRNRCTNPSTTTLVSSDSDGNAGNGVSEIPFISSSGKYVAFRSSATNLMGLNSSGQPIDNNGWADVFLKDLETGKIIRASYGATGTPSLDAANNHSKNPVISENENVIAFLSYAKNLDQNDLSWQGDVFVKQIVLDASENLVETSPIKMVSTDSTGVQGIGWSQQPSLSGDGRFVAFTSLARLVSGENGDNNDYFDVYLKDTETERTTRVSEDWYGQPANNSSTSPRISRDGRYITFSSLSYNLEPQHTGPQTNVFLKDEQNGKIVALSTSRDGRLGGHTSNEPFMSSDGKFVSFTSMADNLVEGLGAGNGKKHIYITSTDKF